MSNEVLIKNGDKANWTPADAAGVIKQASAVANVTAAPTAEEFNALLKSLRDAGILATE